MQDAKYCVIERDDVYGIGRKLCESLCVNVNWLDLKEGDNINVDILEVYSCICAVSMMPDLHGEEKQC